jgi:PadR family transcriptional regulator PadR
MAETVFSLKKGLTEILVLRILSEKEMYGYEIVKTIAERSADVFSVTEAALYTTLYKMEAEELVVSREVLVGNRRRRRYYTLTEKGTSYAGEEIAKYIRMTDGIRKILSGWDKK